MFKKFLLCFCLFTAYLAASEQYDLEKIKFLQGHESYEIPSDHPLKPAVDALFADPLVLYDQSTIDKAGFKTLYHQSSGMRVLRHPNLPGYLVKAYLHSEKKRKDGVWLFERCKGAENIRNLIRAENMKFFTVPDKWICYLPESNFQDPDRQRAILLVTDMKLVSRSKSERAWKTKITKGHLRELYSILNHGFASCFLVYNIPYTKNGTFTCIDTAYPQRVHRLYRITSHLGEDMQSYWKKLAKIKD